MLRRNIKRRRTKLESIAEIKRAMGLGAETDKKIGRIVGLAKGTVKVYRGQYKIGEFRKRKSERLEEIRRLVKEGVNSYEEMRNRIGYSKTTLVRYNSKYNLGIIGRQERKSFHNRDRLIRRGLSLEEIAERERVTEQCISSYIIKTGKHEKWRKSRKHYIEKTSYLERERLKKQEILKIEDVLEQVILSKIPLEDREAYQKAQEYLHRYKRTSYDFENLFTFFKRYYQGKREGKKISLERLREGLIFPYDFQAARVLKLVGEKPLFGSHKREITPKWKKQAIKRAVSIQMPVSDIAYFLGLPAYTVFQSFQKFGIKAKRPEISKVIAGFDIRKLNCRLASQIYEAKDLGFTRGEVMELLDVPEQVYDSFLNHKDEVGGRIVDALRVLYPDRRIRKPYLEFSIERNRNAVS